MKRMSFEEFHNILKNARKDLIKTKKKERKTLSNKKTLAESLVFYKTYTYSKKVEIANNNKKVLDIIKKFSQDYNISSGEFRIPYVIIYYKFIDYCRNILEYEKTIDYRLFFKLFKSVNNLEKERVEDLYYFKIADCDLLNFDQSDLLKSYYFCYNSFEKLKSKSNFYIPYKLIKKDSNFRAIYARLKNKLEKGTYNGKQEKKPE